MEIISATETSVKGTVPLECKHMYHTQRYKLHTHTNADTPHIPDTYKHVHRHIHTEHIHKHNIHTHVNTHKHTHIICLERKSLFHLCVLGHSTSLRKAKTEPRG